jgi:hypothetical protein
MTNLILHISLPRGLALVNGASLQQDVTYDIISKLTPYYCSLNQVKLQGGAYLRKLSDVAVGCQIYQSSQESDLVSVNPPPPVSSNQQYVLFNNARVQYTTALAARDLLLSISGLFGAPGMHVLANFSVSRQKGFEKEGISAKIQELSDSIKFYEPTLRSGGNTMPGGRAKPGMAAKGVFDWTEKTASRLWTNSGMGANESSLDFGSPTGGRGKPTKFFNSPMYSPPLLSLRSGIFQGAYPLVVTNPLPNLI